MAARSSTSSGQSQTIVQLSRDVLDAMFKQTNRDRRVVLPTNTDNALSKLIIASGVARYDCYMSNVLYHARGVDVAV